MRTGLALGKFAPLHKGHQYLIERALEQVDRLIVLIYRCPDLIQVPLSRRAEWIRELYPGVEVIEAPDGPLQVGRTPTVMRMHEEYILRRLAGRRITHFFSSEFYGEHVSRALGARDCRVDISIRPAAGVRADIDAIARAMGSLFGKDQEVRVRIDETLGERIKGGKSIPYRCEIEDGS